ncbi:MAG: endonuclease III [bacterium]
MDEKKLQERKIRVCAILPRLKKMFPRAKIALNYTTTWELVVAVILSAQCTDKKVNEVTKNLFRKYKTFNEYVTADSCEFEQDVRSTGFYRNKSKHILETAIRIEKEYNGIVPNTMGDLLTLPGIARKTANIVLGNAYGVVEGIAVDTHVSRLAQKFDLTDGHNPNKIEQDLMEVVPQKEWFHFPYLLIEYGRMYSPARKRDCKNEPLSDLYPAS